MTKTAQGSQDGVFARFFHWEAASSVVLLGAALAASIWANSPWLDGYLSLSHTPISVSFGDAAFTLSLQHWINDLLMAVFFFVIGLEIKRELIVGELSSLQKAALPVMAALGGMLVPAGVYAAINAGGPGAAGWGVPTATDIAFAMGLLAVFGPRVPIGLKVFLMAVAIADDLGAVVVIAVFYTETIRPGWLVLSGVVLGLMAGTHRAGIRRPVVYIVMALLVWLGVTASGLHPTLAGILVASIFPVRPVGSERVAAGQRIEEHLHPIVAFLILPLFALFNAGVAVQPSAVGHRLAAPVGLGIVLGLVAGKQAGIMLFTWVAAKARLAALPDGVTWMQTYGVASLAGVGFTMSLFITDLAFEDAERIAEAKVAILCASLLAAGWAALVLYKALPGPERGQ